MGRLVADVSYDSSGWGADAFRWFGLPGVPNISWHATGGVFNSPSVIGVGESGPEAVVPLSEDSPWIEKLAKSLNEKEGSESNEKSDAGMYQMMRMAFVSALKETQGEGQTIEVYNVVDTDLVSKKVCKIQKKEDGRFIAQPT